jgi:hypothetical protein
MTKTQLPYVFQDTSSKTLTPTPTENIAGQALASGLNKLKRFFALSLLITLSFNAFTADNFEQPNKEELSKEVLTLSMST